MNIWNVSWQFTSIDQTWFVILLESHRYLYLFHIIMHLNRPRVLVNMPRNRLCEGFVGLYLAHGCVNRRLTHIVCECIIRTWKNVWVWINLMQFDENDEIFCYLEVLYSRWIYLKCLEVVHAIHCYFLHRIQQMGHSLHLYFVTLKQWKSVYELFHCESLNIFR